MDFINNSERIFMDMVLFNTHDVILLLTFFLCLMLTVNISLTKSTSLLSKLFFSGFLLSCAVTPLDILINYGAGVHPLAIKHFPNWFYVFEVGYWVQGPFLLWYIRSLVYKHYSLTWSDSLYLMPFLLFETHQLISYHSLAATVKSEMQENYSIFAQSTVIFFITLAREVLRVFFAVMCILELNNYKQSMRNKFSNFNESNFTWLNLLVIGSLALWVWALLIAAILVVVVRFEFNIDVSYMGLTANYLTAGLFAAVLICLSSRSAVFEDIEKLGAITKKVTKQPINHEHVERLEEVIFSKKPYMDPGLTLEVLAAMVSISPRNLSMLINGHYQCNFYEFINKYRINEAKAMLVSEKHQNASVLNIMYQVGFNSKATFNNFFKKNEGLTPREYKKKHLQTRELSMET